MADIALEGAPLGPVGTEPEKSGIEARDRSRSRRAGGGKLSRSETVTVRLDPKLNYLAELAARAQRRTKSSFIEWAIENALTTVGIPGEVKDLAGELFTIEERNASLWDVDEPDRLVALAAWAPSLLTHEEQVIWKIVATSGFLWRGRYETNGSNEEVWCWNPSKPESIIMERLRESWEDIRRVADGDASRADFWQLNTKIVKDRTLWSSKSKPAAFDADLDEDLPF